MDNKKRNLYIIAIVLAIASITFRIISGLRLEQTSLLFVGLPTLITLLVIKYANTPKSAYGLAFYTILLFLLMAAILFGEGLVCILFMAPIFFGVTALFIFMVTYLKNGGFRKRNKLLLIPVFMIVSQITSIHKNPNTQVIETTITVQGNHTIAALNKQPNLKDKLPNFFKIGFPMPVAINGNGINKGDYRKIDFLSSTKGIGTLHLKVDSVNENKLVFNVISDNSHIKHWLSFKQIKINIKNNTNNTATITWSTYFNCELGPTWYFETLEIYAVKKMNTHLINRFF